MKILDLAIATSNLGKLKEIQAKFKPLGIKLYPMSDFGDFEIEETGTTFIENALIKARYLSKISKLPTLADDSGLVVEALGGAPGIYSARYAGPNPSDTDNYQKLLKNMSDIPQTFRSAYTYCCLVLLRHELDPAPLIAQGQMNCEILTEPRGSFGFGYDPVLYIPELKQTLAQMSLDLKNQISHRAQAMDHLIAIAQGLPPCF